MQRYSREPLSFAVNNGEIFFSKPAAMMKHGSSDSYSEYFVSDHRDWGMALADYMLGEIDEAELKHRLRDSRSVATYAYLAIAANRIAQGDRPAARAALQQSVDEGFYMYYAPKWSKAFLRRIDDPNWLSWFPPVKAASQRDSQDVLSATE